MEFLLVKKTKVIKEYSMSGDDGGLHDLHISYIASSSSSNIVTFSVNGHTLLFKSVYR